MYGRADAWQGMLARTRRRELPTMSALFLPRYQQNADRGGPREKHDTAKKDHVEVEEIIHDSPPSPLKTAAMAKSTTHVPMPVRTRLADGSRSDNSCPKTI